MKNFKFNDFGVCLNSNEYVVAHRKNWGSNYATIITYLHEGEWKGGIKLTFNRFGCSLNFSDGFKTEKECYTFSKIKMLDYLNKNIETESEKAIVSSDGLNFNHFPEAMQLKLF